MVNNALEIAAFRKDIIKLNPISQMLTEYKDNLDMKLYTFDELKTFIGNQKATVSIKIDGEICLSGDTSVKLLDGTHKTVKQLYDLGAKDFYVYSIDQQQAVVPGRCSSVVLTGKNKKVLKITLDNGEFFKCTENHKIMLRNGEYIEAKALVAGASLMPLYTRISIREDHKGIVGYEMCYNLTTDKWEWTHKMVAQSIYEGTFKNKAIHHKNFNKLNNVPDNLLITDWDEHVKLHKELAYKGMMAYRNDPVTGPLWRERQKRSHLAISDSKSKNIKIALSDLSVRKSLSEANIKAWKDPVVRAKRSIGISKGNTGKVRTQEFKDLQSIIQTKLQNTSESKKRNSEKANAFWASNSGVKRKARMIVNGAEIMASRWKDENMVNKMKLGMVNAWAHKTAEEKSLNAKRGWETRRVKKVAVNHKVVSIEECGYEDVYDLSMVEPVHNFALSCGIFVHNCGVKYDGQRAITYTRGGMIRYDMPLTKEMEEMFAHNGISEFTGIGEMFVVKEDGMPLSYLKAQSILRLPKNLEEESRMKMMMFDVYSINNNVIINNPLSERIQKIHTIFSKDGKYVIPAHYEENAGMAEIDNLWKKVLAPEEYGYEGLVVHINDKIIKVKPILSFDMVIVAINRSRTDPGMISAVVASFMDKAGHFRFHGKIGSGFSDHDRQLLFRWAEQNKVFEDDTGQIWVNPFKHPLIAEIQGEEVSIKDGPAYKFENNNWIRIEDKLTGVVRYPVIIQFRPDKRTTPSDLRLAQIPGFPEIKAYLQRAGGEPIHPDAMVIPPSPYNNEGLTERDVWQYYNDNKEAIIHNYKENEQAVPLKAMIGIMTNEGLLYRRKDENDKELDFTNPSEYDLNNTGRTVTMNFVLGDEVDFIYVDVDPQQEFPLEDTKRITEELAEYFQESDTIKEVQIFFNGLTGFHVYGVLKQATPIDEASEMLKGIIREYVDSTPDERISVGQEKQPGTIKLDISTFHKGGGLKIPYSLHEITGLVCKRVEDIKSFKYEDAAGYIMKQAGLINVGGKQ